MSPDNLTSAFSAAVLNNKVALCIVMVLVVVLLVDTSLTKISDLFTSHLAPSWRIGVFAVIALTYILGQFLILEFVKHESEEIRSRPELHLTTIHKMVQIIQYILAGIILVIIFQILVTSFYSVYIVLVAAILSYALATIMMVLLSKRFFSWFASNRNSVVFFYGLSSVALVINAVFTLLLASTFILGLPPEIGYTRVTGSPPYFAPGSFTSTVNIAYLMSSIISFILTWYATAMLLRQYAQKIGRVKYIIIVSLPLLYFLSQFVTYFLNLFVPLLRSDPIFYGILLSEIFVLSKPAGGILFSFAFWIVARNISNNEFVKKYMIISAFGFVLLFTSNQAIVLTNGVFPPFGLATVSFLGLSSYLIFIGIYSSAISVAHDSRLRQSIRKYVEQQSNLLGSIGTSQMEQEVQKRVVTMTRNLSDAITNDTGVQSSLSDDDIKNYTNQVIQEVTRRNYSK